MNTSGPLVFCNEQIDTVLLDMDGTLIDLHFDNRFWNELLPARYAARHLLDRSTADAHIGAHITRVIGTLDYYCIDAWTRFTGLPVAAMHHELGHLLRYRPHSEALLARLHESGRDVRIVTNAHPDSIAVEHAHLGIRDRVAHFYSAHSFGHAKEAPQFWDALCAEQPFDPSRTLLIDDNEFVLDAARAFGIAHTLVVTNPDSARAAHVSERHAGIDSFAPLLESLSAIAADMRR